MTKRLKNMNAIIEKLTHAKNTGDWNKVIYWAAAASNQAKAIKAARKAYRAKSQPATSAA